MVTALKIADVKYWVPPKFSTDTSFVSYIIFFKLQNFSSGQNSVNKQVNYDFKSLVNWLQANKMSLNVGTTKLLYFTLPRKQIDCFENQSETLFETDSINIWA